MSLRSVALLACAYTVEALVDQTCTSAGRDELDEVSALQVPATPHAEFLQHPRGFFCKAAWCSEGSVCCSNDAYGLCGSPGSTCCESPGGTINLCAPGSRCNHETGNCYVGETLLEEKEKEAANGFFCKAAWCAEGSVCCSNDAYGLCGSPGTTCCQSPAGIINLCAPGSHCNHQNGHCYVGEKEKPIQNPIQQDPVAAKGFFCKAAWCSEGSVCCSNDAYGLCGSPGTTCCESPGGTINLCAPGSRCNHETGNCYVGKKSS